MAAGERKALRKVSTMMQSASRVPVLIAGFCLFASFLGPGVVSGAEVLSLDECVRIALENNPLIGISEENYRKSESSLLMSYGGFLPSVGLDFYTGHQVFGPSSTVQFDAQGRPVQNEGFDYESYTFRFYSDIALYDGGATIAGVKSAMRYRDAAGEQLRYEKDLMTAQVIRAYYEHVRSRMLTRVQEEALDQASRNLERTEALLEVGSATRADVLKARVRHSNTRLGLIQARNSVELTREDLAKLLGVRGRREITVDTTLAISFVEPDEEGEISFALSNRPDLRSLGHTIRAAESDISGAKSGWLPTLGANFSYVWNDREMADNLNFFENEYQWSLTGYLSINLFDRFRTSSNVSTAKANRRIAEYNLENARLDAVREIKSLLFSLREARARIEVATETVEQAMEDLRLADERYRVGAGTMLETIDAQVALTQAKADVIDAKCDYLIAEADLSRATGRESRE